ncbi:hypothetical protein ACWGR3_30510 [Streptomyces albidoflavus]
MTAFLTLWLRAASEVDALRAQLAHLEAMWLRAEADADYWYFEANNPDEARARRRDLASTVHMDVRAARIETATRLAALTAAGKGAS